MIRARVCRLLLACAVAAGVWAAVVWFSGGFTARVAGVRLSSTNATPAALIALCAALGAWWASTRSGRAAFATRCRAALTSPPRRTADGFIDIPAKAASRTAVALAIAMCVLGIWRGAPYPGGFDSYGYVSEAELWLHGNLRVEQPLMRQVSWPYAKDALTPVAYAPTADGHAIVPIYPPGLPLTMAALQRVGGRRAVFLAVPLLAAVAIWSTFLLGRVVGGSLAGLVAAALVGTSPVFVFQLMVPMSDVPVTAWWAACLFLATLSSRRAAVAAGAAAGIAILTRPNLAPLAIVPAAIIAVRTMNASRLERAFRIAAFGAPVVVCGGFFAVLNWRLFGSPLMSGYGPASVIFSGRYFWPNVRLYSAWFVSAETPVALIALALPAMLWRARQVRRDTFVVVAGLALFAAGVVASYVWYLPQEAWWLLRYLLPAYPAFMVLAAMALVWLAGRVFSRGAPVVVMGVVLLVMWHHTAFLQARGGFAFRENERKVEAVGEYAARQLPDNAVFISDNFNGSLRYYTGRMTVRFEWVPPDELDRAIADLRRLGLHPYIVVDEFEQENFRKRFLGRSAFGALDWQPVAWLRHSTRVFIYDPAEREQSTGRTSVIILP